MRTWLFILVGLMAGGCASTAPRSDPGEQALADQPQEPVAAALVFSPALGDYLPEEVLARDGRGQAALWGLQGPTTTIHYIRTDDRWGDDDYGRRRDMYRRRAVEYRLGSSVRP